METIPYPSRSATLESAFRSGASEAAMTGQDGKPVADRELLITRLFDAPRDLVFAAWTDPDHLMAWWGPAEFPANSIKADVRPGGRWRHSLRSAEDGRELHHEGEFREIVPPERLVFTFAWDGEEETLVTVIFADHDGKTLMTFHQAPFDTLANRDGHIEGWDSSFDRLVEHLAR